MKNGEGYLQQGPHSRSLWFFARRPTFQKAVDFPTVFEVFG